MQQVFNKPLEEQLLQNKASALIVLLSNAKVLPCRMRSANSCIARISLCTLTHHRGAALSRSHWARPLVFNTHP